MLIYFMGVVVMLVVLVILATTRFGDVLDMRLSSLEITMFSVFWPITIPLAVLVGMLIGTSILIGELITFLRQQK